MSLWQRLLESLGRGYGNRPAAEAVSRALEARYPALQATDVWLRAREEHRDVVAVLYRERNSQAIRTGMPLYKLFAVHRDLTTEELPIEPDSRYAIRGIK
jgi:hypothetical protein